MEHRWSADPPNLLSPEVVSLVARALDDGIVCGIQAFYCSGCGPDPCAFVDVPSYLSAVEKSRPGDWFTLWSVAALAEQKALLLRKEAMPASESELRQIQDWLNADLMREYLAVGYSEQGERPDEFAHQAWPTSIT